MRHCDIIEMQERVRRLELLVGYIAGTNIDGVYVALFGNPDVIDEITANARDLIGNIGEVK